MTTLLGVEMLALLIVFAVDTARKRRSFLQEQEAG
jgi:hypothetical protein